MLGIFGAPAPGGRFNGGVIVVSPTKPAPRGAEIVTVGGMPGTASGTFILTASANGALSLTPSATCVLRFSGGYGRPLMAALRAARALAVWVTALPSMVALPTIVAR